MLSSQHYDASGGKHYNYFRDYDSGIGRYVESDPIGLRGGLNTFAYVGGNPLEWSDWNGLVAPPRDSGGNLLPPPVPLPNGRGGQANHWVPVPGSGTGDRDTKWKPKYPVPNPGGGQPGASWDPLGHWDVDNGQGQRDRYDPDGNRVDHDGNKICGDDCQNKAITVAKVAAGAYILYRCGRMVISFAPPLWWTIPLNAAAP